MMLGTKKLYMNVKTLNIKKDMLTIIYMIKKVYIIYNYEIVLIIQHLSQSTLLPMSIYLNWLNI